MRAPSASTLSIFLACPYSARDGLDLMPDVPGEPALTGSAAHAMIDAHVKGVEPVYEEGANVERARRMFEAWRGWWPSFAGDLSWSSEAPLAYDVESGAARTLPSDGHRDYSARRPTEIVGTADAMAFDGETAHVVDYKTGRAANVTPAKSNPQLAFLALAEARRTGASKARVTLAFLRDDGKVDVDSAELDALDLDVFGDVLRAKVDEVPTAEPTSGTHCKYCRHRQACKALNQAAPATDPGALAILERPGALTADAVAKAWAQLRVIDERVKLAKERVKAEVERLGSVSVGGGKVLRLVDVERENVSKASITRALGAEDGGALIDKLREVGAITVSTARQMQEVNERKGRVA